jgi:hypothetical protein
LPQGVKVSLRHHVTDTGRCATTARSGIGIIQRIAVVVRQFFARSDRPQGIKPHPIAHDPALTVGLTAVIDETSHVPTHPTVDRHLVIQGKDVGIAPINQRLGFFLRDPRAIVLDNAFAAPNIYLKPPVP